MEILLILGMVLLAYWNGANDVSKGIVTLVGSGVTADRKAVAWGALWTVIGSILAGTFALGLVKLFTSGLVNVPESLGIGFPMAVLAGSVAWVVLATRTGMPVSTTHSLTGALTGTALVAFGVQGVVWNALSYKVFMPLLASPVLSMGLTAAFYPLIRRSVGRWPGVCLCAVPALPQWVAIDARGKAHAYAERVGLQAVVAAPEACGTRALSLRITPDTLHWITSGLASLARGMNDTPKIVALGVAVQVFATPSGYVVPLWVFYAAALAMGIGSYLGGLRVTDVLARRVVAMDHVQGFSANLTTALLVGLASPLGLPVSTTHVSSGALFGIGLVRKGKGVQWSTIREIVLAWVVTLPAAGLLGAGVYWVIGGG